MSDPGRHADSPPVLYVSLTGPLLGCYLEVETDETRLRVALNSGKMKHLWCGIYQRADVEDSMSWRTHRRCSRVIPCTLDSLIGDGDLYRETLERIQGR